MQKSFRSRILLWVFTYGTYFPRPNPIGRPASRKIELHTRLHRCSRTAIRPSTWTPVHRVLSGADELRGFHKFNSSRPQIFLDWSATRLTPRGPSLRQSTSTLNRSVLERSREASSPLRANSRIPRLRSRRIVSEPEPLAWFHLPLPAPTENQQHARSEWEVHGKKTILRTLHREVAKALAFG
jgi:hypothetical protein